MAGMSNEMKKKNYKIFKFIQIVYRFGVASLLSYFFFPFVQRKRKKNCVIVP